MTTPYREPGEAPVMVEKMPVDWAPWAIRVVVAVLIGQGPIVAGVLHDVCSHTHEGLCWAAGILALSVTTIVGILTIKWACL